MIHRGISACPGIAIGRAVIINHGGMEIHHSTLTESEITGELKRFREGLERARVNIRELHSHTRRVFGDELASVFLAHKMFLEDEVFLSKIEDLIRADRTNAEWAVHVVTEDIKTRLKSAGDAYLSERVVDLEDVSRQIISALGGERVSENRDFTEDVVIIGHDIAPSDLARYTHKRIVGYITETGGQTSHTSIMAKALGIPTVIGVPSITNLAGDRDIVIVDGTEGKIGRASCRERV